MPQATRPGRHYRRDTRGRLLVRNGGQTAVDNLLLSLDGTRGHEQPDTGQKVAARRVGRLRRPSGALCDALSAQHITYRTLVAFIDAVHADDASRIVYRMGLAVDAGRLAVACAEAAAVALRRVDHGPQKREARQQTEHRSHWAYGIAPRAPVAPCQHAHDDQRRDGNTERRPALDPHINRIEGIAVGTLGHIGQSVVAPRPHGCQQRRGYAAVSAVRCDERRQRAQADRKQ